MKILKIRKLKNGKYKLTFDNNENIELYDEVILKYNLLYNKNIDCDLLEIINQENNFYNYYNKALKYLNVKMRSTKEMSKYLEKFDLRDDEKQKIIIKLKEIGLLNDELYVKAYINDKVYLSNVGPNKIRRELLSHEISENIIEQNINKIDRELLNTKLHKVISKKIDSNHKFSKYQLKNKIINDLINNGYNKEDILEQLSFLNLKKIMRF